ncbi:desmoglein-2-like protein isoform X2 [Ctenopharyngodon idella]|uniref:desmoglein-2-like protein isoform X2 n=1 Tax=Ctenopharyngodon idella TaxID=7959 RepID=UPI0022323A19|nr:desmoglein-2-like protein isoform X2 [Ctenopharyngodon idella]
MAKLFGFSLFIVLLGLTILKTSASGGQQKKIRQKREWIIPPRKLRENVNYMHLEYIAKIRSDEETRTSIRYSLTGPGADSPPINLFTVDRDKGLVKIHGVLDREETPTYHLRGVAKFLNGSYAEKDIDLRIEVEDENDCAPVLNFTTGSVPELSARDTFIMKITATDADEEGTLHTKISYSIVEESHAGMFYINQETGQIFVMHNTLDREKKDTYTVTIKATDMNGAPNGFTGTGTAVIKILDVNDNIPTLEKNFYECRVEENTKNVEVVRIKATDADLIYSENWLAVFTIVSGNEAGYFSITTDNKTNEGILILNKELDFEELKELRLQVSVSNKAEYHSSVVITESKTYTIQVSVINQPEGPRFKPAVKVITISEESTTIDLRKVITNYAAIDSDTLLIANNVRYAKGKDVDNWLIIDERTADIRLNKFPDYESKFLINNTYYAHIICITNEIPAKTATGTIAIQVKDFNDHCPVLIHQSQRMCYEDHVVYVTAVDKDHFPNGAPFGFNVDEKRTKESWRVEHLNDTTAIFRSETTLWPGVYHVFVDVSDQQGKICAGQMLQIDVCTCDASKVCLPEKTVSRFGVSGVFLMLLGLLLLLLVPLLLLFCLCGGAGVAAGFKTIPTDVKEHLIVYNTEGQGEDKKTGYAARKQDMGDSLKVYEYEGQESCMGSFEDICSFMHEDDNLAFLDDLGLRFKTLAEICSGSTIELDMTTTTAVTFKPVLSTTHKDVDVQETVGLLNSQERGKSSAIIHAAGGQQASSTSSTGMYVHEKVMVSNPTLLVQQPALYYAPATPIYVVEPHPTLVMTSSPALDIQENLLVEEQKSSDATLRGTAKREMQHYQSVVLVEKQPTKGSVQAQGSVSGAVQIVNTEVVQSTESHGVRRAIHPVRTVMAGGAREREVCGSLDMRVPQSLYKHS